MRFTKLQCAGIIAATVACSAANARGILIDNWAPVSSVNSTSATVDFSNTALFGGVLAGITGLSFAPGTATPGYTIGTIPGQIEYAFGGSVGMPSEQVIIVPIGATGGSVPTFELSFGYDFDGAVAGTPAGGAGETASVTINGVTYTSNHPANLSDTNGIFKITDGVITNLSAILTGWSTTTTGGGGGGGGGGGTVSAPEMDATSAGSALTLLLGGLMILANSQRKSAIKAS